MSDSYTEILHLLLMETNSHNNDWGTQLNAAVIALLDRAAGFKTAGIAVTGGTTVRIQDDLLEFVQRISGALTGNATIEVPVTLQRANLYINDTTGNFTVTVKVSGQTGVELVRGDTKLLRCNGIDVVDCGMPSYSLGGGVASWCGSIAGTNTYTATNTFIEALSDGIKIHGFIALGNTAAGAGNTLNYNTTGARKIVHSDGTDLASGDIPNNSLKTFTYKLTENQWYMSEVSASTIAKLTGTNIWTAPQTFSGKVTFNGSVAEGVTVLLDAATIAWDMALTARNVQVTLSADRNMGIPTNQVIGQSGWIDFIQPAGGGANITWPVEFDPMGTPLLDETPSARTRFKYYVRALNAIEIWPVYKSGKSSIGYFKEYDLGAFSGGSAKTQAHGLSAYPSLVQAYMQCVSGDVGHSVGSRIQIGDAKDSTNDRGFVVGFTLTDVFIRIGNNPVLLLTALGINTEIVETRWKLIIRVYE